MLILVAPEGYVVIREGVFSFTKDKQLATRIPTRKESDKLERILFEDNIEALQQEVSR